MISPQNVMASIPLGLRDPLFACFSEIARNFAENRWEPAELNGGKFCEIAYTIISGALSATFSASPAKPQNMLNACQALEQVPASAARAGDRSLRILIPRMLPVLYEIRNNRGVGHVGGDVDPNFQDAVAVYQMASWVMAELVRIFHQVSIAEAQEIVTGLVERKHPIIWKIEATRRVLDPELPKGDQALLLLYSEANWVSETDLRHWVEYQNATQFRDRILAPAHRERLLEYEQGNSRLRLTPLGSKDVEQRLPPKYKL